MLVTSVPRSDLPVEVAPHPQLRALYDLALELSALRDLPDVLDTALSHCLDLTDSKFGFIGLTQPEQGVLDVVCICGFHPAQSFFDEHHLIPLRPSLFARAVLEDRPVRSTDAMEDPRRLGQPRGHPPVHTFLGVPLRVDGQPFGMIGVANRPSNYEDAHEHLLITYAAQVAIAIRNAQLNAALAAAKQDLEAKVAARTAELARAQQALAHKAEQLQQLLNETVKVQERERQRISQDLHDGLNQLLVGALLELRTGRERLWLGDRAEADSAFERAGGILHQVESEMREVIHDLRPPALDAVGLVPTLRSTVERFATQTGLACQVTVEGTPARLADEIEISLYRILQEALTNVHLHAQARQVEVIVQFDPQWVALYVRDDGRGFVAQTTIADDHYGLLGMRERAESIGGALSIESRIGLGTQVRILVPG